MKNFVQKKCVSFFWRNAESQNDCKAPVVRDILGNLRATFLQSWVIFAFFCVLGVVGHRGFTIVLTQKVFDKIGAGGPEGLLVSSDACGNGKLRGPHTRGE